ncbi:MAG TPA: hypothetical protein VFU21_13990 [Kofleriaceae bacterium]|nr:hypothetical protein [Kofleriaceae bacterium]
MRSASVWLAIPLLLPAARAVAGPLAQTANAVENKVETSSSSDSAPEPPSSPDPTPSRYDDDCTGCSSSAVVVGAGYYGGGTATAGSSEPILTGPGRLDLTLGAHSVVDSAGALLGELRASKDWIGLGVSGIRYVEHVEDGKREDDVSLSLAAFTISGRVFRHEATELWLDGGLAMNGSSEYDTILGTAWSVRAEQGLAPDLGLRGQVRYYALEHEVSAWEGWAGVRAWFLHAGYRALQFNVGPPLHGPEAGVSLRF